jgi:hypothetical protein
MNLSCKFLIKCPLYLFDFFTFFVKLGCPQGLLLAKQSAFPMLIGKTTQQALMVRRWSIARAIAKKLVHYFRIFLCRSIGITGHAYKQRRRKNRACFASPDIKGLPLFASNVQKRQATRKNRKNEDQRNNSPDPKQDIFSLFKRSSFRFILALSLLSAHGVSPLTSI